MTTAEESELMREMMKEVLPAEHMRWIDLFDRWFSGKAPKVGLASKIQNALSELAAIGFRPDLEPDTLESLADTFNAPTLPLAIGLCAIIAEEKPLTVRRCLYRASVQGLVAGTDDASYSRVQRLVLKLRREGLIPYGWISDSSRRRLKPSSWSGLEDFADTAREAYRKDLWARQAWHIEVFTEKDAMTGVLNPITSKFDLHLNVIRGQVSETFVWEIAEEWRNISKPILALYFGDHDPSGLSIEASIKSRLLGFLPPDRRHAVTWKRLAITAEDFANQALLGLSVKAGDCQGRKYIAEYGDRCVEVDALSANIVRERLEGEVLEHIDCEAWNRLQEVEAVERESIKRILLPAWNGGRALP
jgi:hypothetical protein